VNTACDTVLVEREQIYGADLWSRFMEPLIRRYGKATIRLRWLRAEGVALRPGKPASVTITKAL